jgi:hypothetical protein
VTTKAGSPIAIAAGGRGRNKPAKPVTTLVTVARGSYTATGGGSGVVTLELNAAGLRLLDARYRVPATITIGGTTELTRAVTFSYPRVGASLRYLWGFGTTASTVDRLTVSAIPSGAHVEVICHGGGCPFATRSFKPRHGRVALASAFKGSHLHVRATLELEIARAGSVAQVEIFTIRSGRSPSVAVLCLPPGVRKPARCG